MGSINISTRTLRWVLMASALLAPLAVQAQSMGPTLGQQLGLGTADLLTVVIRLVQWFLGLLGLIFVIMVMFGGMMWMTSAGNEERISKAKQTISAAIIGTIIIMLSWSIVSYVLKTAGSVTS